MMVRAYSVGPAGRPAGDDIKVSDSESAVFTRLSREEIIRAFAARIGRHIRAADPKFFISAMHIDQLVALTDAWICRQDLVKAFARAVSLSDAAHSIFLPWATLIINEIAAISAATSLQQIEAARARMVSVSDGALSFFTAVTVQDQKQPGDMLINKESSAVAAVIAYASAPVVYKGATTTELTAEVVLDLNNSQSIPNNHLKASPRHTNITKCPHAAWASVGPPVGGGGGGSSHTHTPPPITISPSSSSAGSPTRTDPVAGNYSGGTPPTPPSEGGSAGTEEGSTSTTTSGSPPPAGGPSATGANEGLHLTFVLALLAYIAAIMIGILPDSKDTIGGWSTAPQVLYGILVVLAIVFMSAGFMAAGRHVTLMVAGNRSQLGLPISSFCAKLGAILSSALFAVAMACRYAGRWGCAAGVPSAALVAGIMAAFWIWGDETAIVEAVSGCWGRVRGLHRQQRQPARVEIV